MTTAAPIGPSTVTTEILAARKFLGMMLNVDEVRQLEMGLQESEARRAKQLAIQKAEAAASDRWKAFAYDCVLEVAHEKEEFTSDDVDQKLLTKAVHNRPYTHEKRALGAVMMRAARAGYITATDRVRSSNRAKLHASPRRVWVSLRLTNAELSR